jgi:hypothetical protein
MLLAWNWIGLLDIVSVVLSAQRIFLLRGEPEKLQGLIDFPGPLLPLFIVPLVLATHLLVFAIRRGRTRGETGEGTQGVKRSV